MLPLIIALFIFSVSSQNVFAICYTFSLNSTTDTTRVAVEHDPNAVVDVSHSEVEGRRKLIFYISSSGTAPARPRKDYELFPGIGYYKMHRQATGWNQARIICEQEGGHLAIINSEAEYGVIKDIFSRNLPIKDARWDTAAWIGLHDRFKEGEYETVLGEPLESTGFTRWWSGQPDNIIGNDKQDEDCVSIEKFDDMSDQRCSANLAFFCEIPLESK